MTGGRACSIKVEQRKQMKKTRQPLHVPENQSDKNLVVSPCSSAARLDFFHRSEHLPSHADTTGRAAAVTWHDKSEKKGQTGG